MFPTGVDVLDDISDGLSEAKNTLIVKLPHSMIHRSTEMKSPLFQYMKFT